MTGIYIDTSAAMKLVVNEPETGALLSWLDDRSDSTLAASWLLHTELHCATGRNPLGVPAAAVDELLESVALLDLTRGDLISAGTHRPLRSHDAIHLAVALRIGVGEMVTYDTELADAARRAGLRVVAPE